MSETLVHRVVGGPLPAAPFSHAVEAGGFVAIDRAERCAGRCVTPSQETRA